MKKMIDCYRLIPQFWVGYLLFSIPACLYCFMVEKGSGFLLINRMHNGLLDLIFESITNVGDGIFIVCVSLFYLLRKKTGLAFQIILAYIISGLAVQIIKHIVPRPRPKLFFGDAIHIHLINGITCSGNNSFPSGHTASIFSLAVLLSIYYSQKKIKTNICFYLLTIALLIGYSRVYLSQHFPIDVLAGSFLGVLVTLAVNIFSPITLFEKNFSKVNWHSLKLH
jgi:membrane-associated phospholipid phosphatase